MSDIDGDFVHVSRAVVRDPSGEWVTKDPKTASSVRSVLLPHFVVERIQEQRYITHLLPSQVSNRFWKKQRNLGIPPYCFHSLRHFHASYLHYLNIPDAYIQKRGGWANASTLQNIYPRRPTFTPSARSKIRSNSFLIPNKKAPQNAKYSALRGYLLPAAGVEPARERLIYVRIWVSCQFLCQNS